MRELTRAGKAKARGASMTTKRAEVTWKWIETAAGETRKCDDGVEFLRSIEKSLDMLSLFGMQNIQRDS